MHNCTPTGFEAVLITKLWMITKLWLGWTRDWRQPSSNCTDTLCGVQEMSVVNVPGLYTLVLGARKPEVRALY